MASLGWKEWHSIRRVSLILSYTFIGIFPIYKFHFKDSPSLHLLYKYFPESITGNFLHGMFSWRLENQTRRFQGGCLDLVTENRALPTMIPTVMWERQSVFFRFLYSVFFFIPDNFLQLTWDLIVTSWSFTCFDIWKIKTSVRLPPCSVWKDLTQTLPKQWLVLPVCFLLKGDLKDGFSFESVNLGTGWGRIRRSVFSSALPLLLLYSEEAICFLCLRLPLCKIIIKVPFKLCLKGCLLHAHFLHNQKVLSGTFKRLSDIKSDKV